MPQPDDKLREALTRWGHDDDSDLIDPEPAYLEPLSAQEEADRADRMVPGDGPW